MGNCLNPQKDFHPGTIQDAIGLLGHLGTLLDRVQPQSNSTLQVLFHQAAFQPLCPKPAALPQVVVIQGQDPELGLNETHTTGPSPLIQPVLIPLQNCPTLQKINIPAQIGGVSELAEDALDSLAQIIN
ncbi:integral membrane protein dgcr2 idd [Pitangus sulphuratus]|nr:integral membrane protein dgcr2 idd [Pitangus sulphuratus]